jgi:NAD(P)-dependent dehydrogenase (short-subunit alcohol dehydrogenase family)
MELLGKVALVTGGASGIGRATCLALAGLGADLAIVDRNREGATQVAEAIGATGRRALAIGADVAVAEEVRSSVRQTIEAFGRIDILVNGAGITDRNGNVLELDEETWDRVQAVNLKATFLYIQEVGRHMVARGGGGKIVNISSSSAFRALAVGAAYGASKAGVVALTRAAAAQLGPHDINVNAVAPGLTNTPITTIPPESMAQAVQEGPLANLFGRVSEPEDVAAVIAFLCLPASRQITAQTIHTGAGSIV